jgi:cytochrome c551/c552
MVSRAFAMIALALAAVAVSAQDGPELFRTSEQCMACHNGLQTAQGEDVSIGASWRGSMMANSSRDPYWQAAVRREVIDHPSAAAAIEDECAVCHMPMSRTDAAMSGRAGKVFDHLGARAGDRADRLARDGVGCMLCHQITSAKLGARDSFTGGYVLGARTVPEPRPIFGPFQIERGLSTIMRSATAFQPNEGQHVRDSGLCGTCHTLVTKALGPDGSIIGELPEQMSFLEWKYSAFAGEERSCQSCHMPAVEEEMPISSVLGGPRKGLARHSFIGGNFFVLQMLDRYRRDLLPETSSGDLAASVRSTLANLENNTAELSVDSGAVEAGRVVAEVTVRNLAGHKFPTGYPSRRAWLHVALRDRRGETLFESGAIAADGSIRGNDNDADAGRFEPHYAAIDDPGQVQIYESVMADSSDRPTTGLLTAVRYLKDNRLLPKGFQKADADPWVAVIGDAREDSDFSAGGDRLRYSMAVDDHEGPFQLDVELRFQVVGFRWAENLRTYKAEETSRFVRYFESMASSASAVVARATATIR